MRILSSRLALAAITGVAIAACNSSDNQTGTGSAGSGDSTVSINAATVTAYVTLGTSATYPTVTDPTTSTAWDLAFTPDVNVKVNGGLSGPGGVEAYCICANKSLTLTQVEALTASQGVTAFDAVTTTSIPADTAFHSDTASAAITGWFSFNQTTQAVTPDSNVWGIRLNTASDAYAKFHVIAIANAGETNAGMITLQWAVQSSSSGTLGADQQVTIDLSSGAKVYVNLSTGATATGTAPPAWDVAFQGYTAYLNGGVSGSGDAAAVLLVPSSFYTSYASITGIPVGATGIPSEAFTTDGAGGAFLVSAPYQYDPTSHQVYPTFNVYLVKRGTAVYKVQVVSYYSTGGLFGYLTLRYAKLTS